MNFEIFVRVLLGLKAPFGRYKLMSIERARKRGFQGKVKMVSNRFNNEINEPLCKFGPGGDFNQHWPPDNSKIRPLADNPIGRVLMTIADIIGATIKPELINQLTQKPDIKRLINANTEREDKASAAPKTSRTNHAETTGGTEADSAVRGEPMLFADDCGTGRRVRRKPNHRIRAYHRAAKKAAADKFDGQGTLFDLDATSQSAA